MPRLPDDAESHLHEHTPNQDRQSASHGSWGTLWFREASRVEPRDYVDTAAALGRYTVAQLIGLARRLDPGLTERDFADAGRQPGRMPDQMFARYGLTP